MSNMTHESSKNQRESGPGNPLEETPNPVWGPVTCPVWGIVTLPTWGVGNVNQNLTARVESLEPTVEPRGTNCRRAAAETEIEKLMRKEMRCPSGRIANVQKVHVHKVTKSRAAEKVIGTERAAKVWGWLAEATKQKKVSFRLTTEWTNEWISNQEHKVNELRADSVWEVNPPRSKVLEALANREEAMEMLRTWMKLNEEPAKMGWQVLRAEKREALRTSKANYFRRVGGPEAMYAAIALLTLTREVVMETDRGTGGVREAGVTWIQYAIRWAAASDWVPMDQVKNLIEMTEAAQTEMRKERTPREGRGDVKIMDVGEGWGSIGIAVAQIPGCSTIGVDRVGFLDQGDLYGQITSRVNLDLCTVGSTNILRRAAKLASRPLETFTMIWMSPECRILTSANSMNVAKGCTNGRRLDDPRNTMGEEELKIRKEEYQQCLVAIENQMEALDQEANTTGFAVENPATSDLWKMEAVRKRMEKNKDWRLVEVDQCAYGRKCKKPTKIMTNLTGWTPKGLTGNGKCVPLRCGGTKNNEKGAHQNRHEQQMITSDPSRKPREGKVTGERGRREYSVRASKNLVQAELVIELVKEAILMKEKQEKQGEKGSQVKRKLENRTSEGENSNEKETLKRKRTCKRKVPREKATEGNK
jgi:hypothetical protein